MNFTNIALIFALLVYVVVLALVVNYKSKHKKIIKRIQNKDDFYLFGFEKKLMNAIGARKSSFKKYIITIRILAFILAVLLMTTFGFITLFLFSAIAILIYSNTQNKKVIDSTGINYIILINQFLDSYIPAISSGLSNDQAMLKFINSQNDEGLFSWWVNKDDYNVQVEIENKWKRIIEIYRMVQFNEERGIGDTLPIIKQMQDDLNEKQKYYDDYQAKVGEIKPIMFSYYIGVPIILFISWNQVRSFWVSAWGLVAAFVLAILFFAFEMLINKLKKDTIEIMF